MVVEGYMDVIALAQQGLRNAVATLGTATSDEHLKRLFRVVPSVLFCFDGDAAGRKAAWRALEATLSNLQDGRRARFLFLPEGEDPDSLVRREGTDAFRARIQQHAQPLADYFFQQLRDEADPRSLEGKAHLATLAAPLIEKIPGNNLRTLMRQRLAELTGLQGEALQQLAAAPQAAPPRLDGRHPVLGVIDVQVREGDRICLLGPSGVGKTTLLNGIAGLDPQLRPMIGQRAGLRVGYLFQEHRLLPWRTVRQNLALVGASAADIERLLAEVGLSGAADSLPDQLSLGMARRAALARCLAIKPDLLLLDEPFASLDAERAAELRGLIARLLDQHPAMAMICVTHDPRDADDLANRLWYLSGAPATLRCDEPPGSPVNLSELSERQRRA